jgi:hypothetical protein
MDMRLADDVRSNMLNSYEEQWHLNRETGGELSDEGARQVRRPTRFAALHDC